MEESRNQKAGAAGKAKNIHKCPVSAKCGGCRYRGITYEEQLEKKQDYVRKLLKPFGKPEPIRGMPDPFGYRNKVFAAFSYQKGKILSGVYEEKTHRVINIDKCLIEDPVADAIIADIKSLLRSFKITIYDEDTRYGLLRHVMVRRGKNSGEVRVVLVVRSPSLPSKNNFVRALRALHPEITTIVLNLNDRNTSMVLGDRNTVLYGKGYITDTLCGVSFRISPNSFYQVNTVQTEVLYGLAMEMAGLTQKAGGPARKPLSVIDAYCGIGTIGLIAAESMKAAGIEGEVIGVESNEEAVQDAIVNAKSNESRNIRFYRQDAGEFMTKLAAEKKKADIVFMDPPRAGSDAAFLSSLVKLSPETVVYISCNPETLARDLKYLTKHRYEVKRIVPVDMFPWTEHVETVCLMSKREK